jgi:hypothetical protein
MEPAARAGHDTAEETDGFMKRSLTYTAPLLLLLAGFAAAQDQQQVNVSVKIVEFQTTLDRTTGLSAYFRRFQEMEYGKVVNGSGAITSADITYPTGTGSGITVFLDNLHNHYGDFEIVLQGLVDQNRAFILSRPKATVMVGQETPTVIQTSQEIPYESTVVVGTTVAQVTEFKPTGVILQVRALQVIDDDNDQNTTDDTYINLELTATVNEEGQRITVSLDDMLGNAGWFTQGSNAISVPEFVSRSIMTTVWVRHGQVLILGGLYRNTKNKNLATLPWLTQGENFVNGTVQRISPFSAPRVPLSSALGNETVGHSRRELVFLIRTELWRPAYTIADEFGFIEEEEAVPVPKKEKKKPGGVISGVLEEISDLPRGVAEGISGQSTDDEVTGNLGGEDK